MKCNPRLSVAWHWGHRTWGCKEAHQAAEEKGLLPHLDSNTVWWGVMRGVGCGSEGEKGTDSWQLYPSTFFPNGLLQIPRGLWLFSLSSRSLMIDPTCASDLQWTVQLWEHTIPRSQSSFSPPRLLKALFFPFVHIRNKLALQMTYVDCYFAFHHKSKGLLFYKCVNWVEQKTFINTRKDYLLFFLKNLQGLWVCQSRRLTAQQGLTVSKVFLLVTEISDLCGVWNLFWSLRVCFLVEVHLYLQLGVSLMIKV